MLEFLRPIFPLLLFAKRQIDSNPGTEDSDAVMFANFELFRGGWVDADTKRRYRRSCNGCLPCVFRFQCLTVTPANATERQAVSGRRNVVKNGPFA